MLREWPEACRRKRSRLASGQSETGDCENDDADCDKAAERQQHDRNRQRSDQEQSEQCNSGDELPEHCLHRLNWQREQQFESGDPLSGCHLLLRSSQTCGRTLGTHRVPREQCLPSPLTPKWIQGGSEDSPGPAATMMVTVLPLTGSSARNLSPAANHTFFPSWVTPPICSTPGKGPYSRMISALDRLADMFVLQS